MGWTHEDHPDHEGYVVGAVLRLDERGRVRDEFWREVQTEEKRSDVTRIQAACTCGWRSPRIVVWPAVECDGIVLATERDRDRCAALWDEHISLERFREIGSVQVGKL